MKKIFTLTLGLMLTVAMFAAGRRPIVTVNSAQKYEIVIGGNHYFTNGDVMNISNLPGGRYGVKVYEVRSGFFTKSKKLVASSVFELGYDNIQINITRFGQIKIAESKFGRDWNEHNNSRVNDREHNKGNVHDFGKEKDRNYGHNRKF